MKAPKVAPEIWKRLFRAALEFANREPWNALTDAEVYGVGDAETGETGWCAVLGALREVFGIAVYRGPDGFWYHDGIQRGRIRKEQALFEQNALLAEFVPKRELEKEDRSALAFAGLSNRSKTGYPKFRSFLPGYFGWHITEAEARFLIRVFRSGNDFYSRFLSDPGVGAPDRKKQRLIYQWQGTGFDEAPIPERVALPRPVVQPPAPVAVDEIRTGRVARLQRLPGVVWEAGAAFIPTPIEEGDRPYYPRLGLVVESGSGFVLEGMMYPPEKGAAGTVVESVLTAAERAKALPSGIRVEDDLLRAEIAPVAEALRVPVDKQRRLPDYARARDAFLLHLEREGR